MSVTAPARAASAEPAKPLVQVKSLGRIFDVSKPWLNRVTEGLPRRLLTAAADVTFSINKRETFALVGESGSGKSTVAKMVVGLIAPTTGEVVIDGVSMSARRQESERRRLRRRIQMIFQDPYASLNPRWRALDIIAEPLRAFGIANDGMQVATKVGELPISSSSRRLGASLIGSPGSERTGLWRDR